MVSRLSSFAQASPRAATGRLPGAIDDFRGRRDPRSSIPVGAVEARTGVTDIVRAVPHRVAMGHAAMGKIPSLDMSRAMRVVAMMPRAMRENLRLRAGGDEEGQDGDYAEKNFHYRLHFVRLAVYRFHAAFTKKLLATVDRG